MAKVDKWLKKKNLRQITDWARDDRLNISDIAEKMEISSSTFRQWRNDYPEIAQAFDEGRRVVDEKVENSFIKMCTGYHEKVLKKQKVKRKEYDDRGKVIAEYEEFVDVEEEEYIPPSVAAQKFYLLKEIKLLCRNAGRDIFFLFNVHKFLVFGNYFSPVIVFLTLHFLLF